MADFVHLHLHTEFSLLDGACKIDELLAQAERLKMQALAVTEHGNMFSAIAFHDRAKARGIKPILGCEAYVAPGSRLVKGGPIGEAANHLVLLAETDEGYRNLVKLVSAGYTEGFYYRPRIDKDLLAAHARGLIGLSGCLKGEIPSELRADQERRALDAAATYRDILGAGNFFLELQDQGIAEQRTVNAGLLRVARELNLPFVCTNDVHYLHRTDAKPHDILLCIGTGKTVTDPDRMRYHGEEFYLKTAGEMAAVFPDLPDAFANTVRIAERCVVNLEGTEYHLPTFDVPVEFTLNEYFEHVVRAGFDRRAPHLEDLAARGQLRHGLEEYRARLAYEIDVITRMGFAGYFLIVWDFIRYAREQGIPVGPGRGSAAGSLVAYCLKITDVDPLIFDLLFERFLNPERISLPDIDIDFCERRRGEVIDYVTRKYGRENVAQIITFGTMKARAVVRDVGRALDIPYADVDRVAKQIPAAPDMTLDKALDENPALKQAEATDPRVRELLEVARRLEGMTRHASVHAAGVVITPRPLTEFVPLYKGQHDEITTQWSMKEIERIGLLKMDFLGLTTLTLLHDAVEHIRETTGEQIALDALPLDDARTYQLFAEGHTLGVFQFESSGMRDVLRKAKPQRFDDLIALNALYRPGPLRSGMIEDFVARRHGKMEIKYEVPQLEPILRDTYGVITYQEQVMRIASVLGGFTLGEADGLRKAMSKKAVDVMQKKLEAFVTGAVSRGISEKKARKIAELMEHFGGYGFNKSHATTYALLAYRTAYLKANYPWHFMASLLTLESQNTDKLVMYLGECRDRGIPVLPPDVNCSELRFAVTPDGIRFGLAAVRNAGEGALGSVLEARRAEGRVTSLFRLCELLDLRLVNRRVLEGLAKSGALDGLGAAAGPGGEPLSPRALRPRLLAAIDRACEHGARCQRDRSQGQAQLFGGGTAGDADDHPDIPLGDAAAWAEAQQLAAEKEALGLYLSGHPLDRHAADLRRLGARSLGEISGDGDNGTPLAGDVAIGGVIASIRPLRTRKKGDRMAVIGLEDPHGTIEVVVFPDTFAKAEELIKTDTMVVVRGRLERDEESARLIATEVVSLEAACAQATREVAVRLSIPPHSRQTFEALADVFARHPGDRRISLEVEVRGQVRPVLVRAAVQGEVRVRPSETLVTDVERICGKGSVSLR
ncbi:MAG: DNA polymerase III subunit alpha [Acidobacteria bacterium]|nr:DNA polymerase III subunit alpha [Acidobacteriota bacterium]